MPDPQQLLAFIGTKDSYGLTCLHWSVHNNCPENINLFLNTGADGRVADNEASILDLSRVSYVLYDVKYIGLVSLWASILGYILDLSCVSYVLYDVKYIGLVSLWASILGYMLDLSRVSYVLYDVKYIGLVSLWASILGYMLDMGSDFIAKRGPVTLVNPRHEIIYTTFAPQYRGLYYHIFFLMS